MEQNEWQQFSGLQQDKLDKNAHSLLVFLVGFKK